MKKGIMWFMVWLLPVMLFACSSGGGGGGGDNNNNNNNNGAAATALTVASQVSVVDAKLSGSVGVAPLKFSWAGILKALSAPPAGSDYDTDKTNVYVQERSVESFNIVNEILCMIDQTKYDAMLNKGAYKAQVDMNQCSSEKGDASSAGQESSNQSSSSTAPDYELWTVDVTRADNSSPQYIKAWIHEKASEWDPAKVITVKVEITEGKSDTNPFGIFTMNFAAYPVDPNTGAAVPQLMFKGYLKSERQTDGTILLKFVCKDTGISQDFSFEEAVTLNKASADSGSGTVYGKDSHMEGQTLVAKTNQFDIAYNASYFLRKDAWTADGTDPDVCLDRNKFETTAWRYGMYDATTGTRINRNSGFPIQKDGAYGNVGYWGLWLPDGVMINNGDTIYKHDYQTGNDTAYTIFKALGKLKKHTRKLMTLGEIKNIPLNYGICSQSSCTNYQVIWGGTPERLIMTAVQDQTNWSWDTAGYPQDLDLSTMQWGDIFLWSQALNGQVRIKRANCTWNSITNTTSCDPLTSSSSVVFYSEDIVYPTDAIPASFACYDQCPQATSSGVDMTNPYYTTWDPMTGQSIQRNYTFDANSMLLTDGTTSNSVISASTNSQYQWGIMSGALFDPAAVDLTSGKTYAELLKCDWDPNQTCGWKAWSELPVFYTWETGPNNWNQFTAIKDSGGTFVKFDPPLQVPYTHTQTDTTAYDYKYNGTKFYLEYAGFGQLHGIPGKCVNWDTGETVSCGPNTRWVPEFTIPAGALLGVSNEYITKPLDMEQQMKQAVSCPGLTTTSYSLPAIGLWVDPAIGAEPTNTGAPKVIGGVVQ